MSHPRIITENMLDEWIRANAREAQGVTVELVWRLVAASCPSPNHRRFPLSDSIGQHGPDGELDTPVGFPPSVPDGRSYWEIGAAVDARAKANSDYNDLTAIVPQNVREASSFVFVTPLSGRRDWENTWKADGVATWVEEHRNRNDWASVHVLNGASLIDWLYRFPAVERWLAGVMGMKIDFIETLDARWEAIRMIGSPPPLLSELFTVSREAAVQKLQKLVIDHEGTQLKLDTRQPEQAADFVSAYASALPEEQRVEAIGRCLIVTQEDAWPGVCSLNESHVLIADFDLESERGLKLIQSALNRRHTVVFAGMPGGVPHANRAPLPVPDEYQIKAALEKAGYPKERSRMLANACRSDLNSLLRCLQGLSAMPEWAQMTDAAEIAIAMLIGGWVENVAGDCAAVEGIVGKQYGEWISVVRNITSATPTPLHFRNGSWNMTSRFEAWQLLGRRIFDDDLERFKTGAIAVLREIDPALEIAPNERIAASVHGNERPHSNRLRKGLAGTLSLLGTYPKALSACTDGRAEGTAIIAVREVLSGGSWSVWASLNEVLPLLAEASPEAFLDAVNSAIHSEAGVFKKVFSEESAGIGGRTYITGLLWGLETLAWESNYLVQVCRILADLAAVDPGGSWSNRPANSLTAILLPWFPQTCAAAERRHAAVRMVAKRQPQVGWKLLLSLLPESHSVSSGTHKPIWRPFIPDDWKEGTSQAQYLDDVLSYGELAVALAGSDAERLAALIERYFRLPEQTRSLLRESLISGVISDLDEGGRFRLWSALSRLITNHRKFAGHENWHVPEGALEELDAIAERLAPAAPEVRHKRLFKGVDADLFEQVGNYHEQGEALHLRRQEAVREVLTKGGRDLLVSFAKETAEPWRVGFSYGSLDSVPHDETDIPLMLESSEKALLQFCAGYICGRYKVGGWAWVDSLPIQDWATRARAQFFTFLPFSEQTWARVATVLPGEESEYWQNTPANPYESTSGLENALKKLLSVDRADAVMTCLQGLVHQDKAIPTDTAVEALKALTEKHRIDAYAIGEVLTRLQQDERANEDDIRKIEWKFLIFLGDFQNGQPIFLSRWMAEDPKFFCQVIRLVFRSSHEGSDSALSEEDTGQATSAYHLLKAWRTPPGTQRDGTFSPPALNSWIAVVKAECLESGHWEVASSQIGEVLFHAPRDTEGLWIEAVCEVLDKDDHDGIRKGLTMEVFNSRGVFTPDGGVSERALAAEWSQKASLAEQKGYSFLGQELRRLSKSYETDAEREAHVSWSEID